MQLQEKTDTRVDDGHACLSLRSVLLDCLYPNMVYLRQATTEGTAALAPALTCRDGNAVTPRDGRARTRTPPA